MDINDSVGIKGVVVFKDSNGNVIFKKQNTILPYGRGFILYHFLRNQNLSWFNATDVEYEGFAISGVGFGQSTQATTTLVTGVLLPIEDVGSITVPPSADLANMSIKFSFDISDIDESYMVSEVGLTASNSTTTKYLTRAVFDPIPIEPGESFSLDYYIYF